MKFLLTARVAYFAAGIIVALVGCSRYERPRTREDIFHDRESVDTLYLTEDGQRLVAPKRVRGMTVDVASGKLAWQAWECGNPNCPARGTDGKPFLFPRPDPFAYVNADGEPDIRQPTTADDFKQMDEYMLRRCPACLTTRKLSSETAEQREQFQNFVKPHVLPQAEMRLRQLDEEYQAYIKRQSERSQ